MGHLSLKVKTKSNIFKAQPKSNGEFITQISKSWWKNIQGIRDPFGKYGGTILYELNDSKDFQEKLHYFLNHIDIQKDLGEKAKTLSSKLSGKNRFTENWKKIAEKLYE